MLELVDVMNDLYIVLGQAEIITDAKFEKLEHAIKRFEILFKKKLIRHVDGTPRTRGIHTPKTHKIMKHTLDYCKWWGTAGIENEENMENYHQLYKRYHKCVITMHGPRKILTLEKRLANKNLVTMWKV